MSGHLIVNSLISCVQSSICAAKGNKPLLLLIRLQDAYIGLCGIATRLVKDVAFAKKYSARKINFSSLSAQNGWNFTLKMSKYRAGPYGFLIKNAKGLTPHFPIRPITPYFG